MLDVLKVLIMGGILFSVHSSFAQIDPFHRNLLQLGVDQPLVGKGPQGVYLYYYFNDPDFIGTNIAFRAAIAPAYVDGELGFKQLISRYTDFGIGVYGGAYGDNFYEVRQGHYYQDESFYGYGGGTALSIYQHFNPGMLIPLQGVLRLGMRYVTYDDTGKTDDAFELPHDRVNTYVRTGLRLAGKEPMLYPDLAMELSAWFERIWRSDESTYGFANDRKVEAFSDLYWVYAAMNYSWTNVGHKLCFAATLGGSHNADRFSAWRLGGVLPLVAEFPLELPGYYYQELTAKRVAHLSLRYLIALDHDNRFQLGVEGASAYLDYLSGFEQPSRWQTGAGCAFSYTPRNQWCRLILRYGYGFNAVRDGKEGAHSVGLLLQYDFEQHFKKRRISN
jgi:hypothetical protein